MDASVFHSSVVTCRAWVSASSSVNCCRPFLAVTGADAAVGVALALTLPWLAHSYMAPQTGECRVLRVVDGDGVRLDFCPGRDNLNVRLYCIDPPETSQAPWGDRSFQHLPSLLRPTVALEGMDTDRYGRTIGRLISDGRDPEPANGDRWPSSRVSAVLQ